MPKYMILNSTYLQVAGQIGPRMFEIGDVVDYAGEPGSSLAPMDAEAQAKFDAMVAKKFDRARAHVLLAGERGRRLLTPGKLRELEAAEATIKAAA